MRKIFVIHAFVAGLGLGLLACVITGAVVGHFSHPIAGIATNLLLPFIALHLTIRALSKDKKG